MRYLFGQRVTRAWGKKDGYANLPPAATASMDTTGSWSNLIPLQIIFKRIIITI
jgi:hypothetical protein